MHAEVTDTPFVAPADPTPVDISVVLVGLNACKFILECIASLRAAHWPDCRYEVIYIDNGSKDDSVAQVRSKLTPTSAPGRLKQWLVWLARNYPEAAALFAAVRTQTNCTAIDALLLPQPRLAAA